MALQVLYWPNVILHIGPVAGCINCERDYVVTDVAGRIKYASVDQMPVWSITITVKDM